MDNKRPVFVITGFLGSGKTTLLNQLVNHAEMKDTAVIINEFGEVGIDHLLIESSFEDAVLLKNGCLCCTIRGDLLDTLETLASRQEQGDIPSFSRVVIETTGLADPAPILQTLMQDPVITARYRLSSIVTTIDTVNGSAQLRDNPEAVKQAAIADLLLLNKTDIADEQSVTNLTSELNALNPTSEKRIVLNGEIDSTAIFGRQDFNLQSKQINVEDWLGRNFENHAHNHDSNRHDHEISTFCISKNTPLPWPQVKQWLQAIISLRGQDVLRVKGIIELEGLAKPVAIHGVQHTFHDPVILKDWQNSKPRSNIIFIGRNLIKAEFEAALDHLLTKQAA